MHQTTLAKMHSKPMSTPRVDLIKDLARQG